jgi:hypothetical protein
MMKPNKEALAAATIIATGYREVLAQLGHPDEMNQLPAEIQKVAEIIMKYTAISPRCSVLDKVEFCSEHHLGYPHDRDGRVYL